MGWKMTREQLRELAKQLAVCSGIEPRAPTSLRLVDAEQSALRSRPERASPARYLRRSQVLQRVQDLADIYGLHWLIRQECEGVDWRPEHLNDTQLIELKALLERVGSNWPDGFSMDDLGLLKRRILEDQ